MRAFVVLLALAAAVAGCSGGKDASGREATTTRADAANGSSADDRQAAAEFRAEGWKTDFSRHSVPLWHITSGGPGKDGIPSIDRPRFVSVGEADAYLAAREPVIALTVHGETRAYPIQILIWHEIVNDKIGGIPVSITFCPLCNTAIVFERRVDGRTLAFGVSGKLRNSDLVMYDRQSESWWQQFGGESIAGRYTGARLSQLPARIVAWSELRRSYPDARVLSRRTGYVRPYGENPYLGYDDVSRPPFFPAKGSGDRRLAPKERVVFVERADDAVAVPFSVLRKRRVIPVTVGGRRLVVRWRPGVPSPLDTETTASGRDVGAAEVREHGRLVPFDEPFWFAVASFRPTVRIVR